MKAVLARHGRLGTVATLVGLGGAVSAATWVSGDHGFAVAMGVFYAVAALVTYVVSGGDNDFAAIMRTDGDERQRGLDREATRLSGLAMGGFAIAGTIVQLARGEDPGGFVWTCTVGGIAYVVALVVLRRRS